MKASNHSFSHRRPRGGSDYFGTATKAAWFHHAPTATVADILESSDAMGHAHQGK